eukprot:TRINITY_DN52581_c0_g1_i1.p1 TRINITY_DN52581_c0_g1~~TRINITY_DN52581_c0_g1_i1.p1  ORF type:complete len:459 (+),score=107.62 TRINITY_DN52581_c0_g1_i1:70-1377(+)
MAGYGRMMFVAGGSGFIGSNVCRESLKRGFKVVSLSRTGKPSHIKEPWAEHVEWIQGDVQDPESYLPKLRNADAIVSCIGRFGVGNNSDVYEVNADHNINLAQLAKRECERLSKFAYISTQPYSPNVQYPFRAYFNSKLKAETLIQTIFPKNYLILRPTWVFGWRHIAGPLWCPTQLLGAPVEHVMGPIAEYCEHTKLVVPPQDVTELAHVIALGCTVGRDVFGVVPTKRVRDIIEREAQGRPLDDWLAPYWKQLKDDFKVYLEETNWVDKYGLDHVAKQNMEKMVAMKRYELNPATHRPEFAHPVRGPAFLHHGDTTPMYQRSLIEERRQEYLEGRRVQQMFEAKKNQELLDGQRRLLGEDVPACDIKLPGHQFERDTLIPAREAVPDTRRLGSAFAKPGVDGITPTDFEWKQGKSTGVVGYVGTGSFLPGLQH